MAAVRDKNVVGKPINPKCGLRVECVGNKHDNKNAEGIVKCRKCETVCKDNSGHGNLASHVKQKHASCWEEELKQHLEAPTRNASGGSMDAFVNISNVVSD